VRAHRRNILFIVGLALLAFQVGFKPIGLERRQTLAELSEARYEFEHSLVNIPREEPKHGPSTESAEAESAATEWGEPAPIQPDVPASEQTMAREAAGATESQAPAAALTGELAPQTGMTAVELQNEMSDLFKEKDAWVLVGGVKVEENVVTVRFAFPKDTKPADVTAQRQLVLTILRETYSDRAGSVRELTLSAKDMADAAAVVAQIGSLQLRRPVPQVQLGLDLRGGTRMVMEAVPITHYVFEDRADILQEAAATESGPPEAESASPQTESAPRAEEAPDQPESPEGEQKTDSRAEWRVIGDNLRTYLDSLGNVTVRSVTPTTTGVVLDVKTVNEAESNRVRDTIRNYLRQIKPEIRCLDPESFFIQNDTIARVREIMQRRVDGFGLTEPIIQTQGDRRIIVEIPGTTPADIEQILDKPADLKLMYIDPNRFTLKHEKIPLGEIDPRRPEKKERVIVYDAVTNERVSHEVAINDTSSRTIVRGSEMVDNSQAHPGQRGDWEVTFQLKPGAANRFREFTSKHIKEPLPIVLNNVIESAPVIESTIGAHGRITGGFTIQEANNLKTLLNAGALPVPLEVAENREVSATLGATNVQRSLVASGIALLIIFTFMLCYYRLPGVVADVALVMYTGIVLAILVMFDATLTLTGIAGLILGIGMAVDANILIFERMKEELRTKSLTMAVRVGFERAWTAILDSNVTTLLAAFTLWIFGSGGVRGFATTLIISVLASMFSAIFVSRVLLEIVVATRLGTRAALYLGARPESVTREDSRRGRRPLR